MKLSDKFSAPDVPGGYTIVLSSQLPAEEGIRQDTPLPFSGSSYRPAKAAIPERLREMRRLYEYGRESLEAKARNFYRQAVFMQDYEDDVPWEGDFTCYYPTYHDLTTQQLRGYFAWRAEVRRGNYHPISASAAYLYIYELLNGIGTDSPEDSLRQLKALETGYLDSGIGDERIRRNLRRWMLEFAVVQDLPPETARQAADREMLEKDTALSVLHTPGEHSDDKVFSALCIFAGKKPSESPVLAKDSERGRHLFCEAWRLASAYRREGQDLFTLCFGERKKRLWYPLSNAVYYSKETPHDRNYILTDCRSYHCRNGRWYADAYEKLFFDRSRLQGFLHETDAKLRRYLKTGRYLRENPADAWAIPYINAVIEADRKTAIEAARPKITIDLSGLEQIRRDAVITRDSLLTGEDLEEMEKPEVLESSNSQEGKTESEAIQLLPNLPLDLVQIQLLDTLLRGWDTAELLKKNHLMPSIAADSINEALFDEIGDTVLVCEDDRLFLIEDYRDELEQLLGGTENG